MIFNSFFVFQARRPEAKPNAAKLKFSYSRNISVIQFAVPVPVEKVNDEAYRKPESEPKPVFMAHTGQQIETRTESDQWDQ